MMRPIRRRHFRRSCRRTNSCGEHTLNTARDMLRSVVARSLLPRGLVRPFAVDASLGSVDHYFEKTRIDKSKDSERKEFTYFMFATNKFVYASAVRLGAIAFISSMSASKDVLALASAEFEIGNIEPGSAMTVKWRGKPVFIRHRTADEIAKEEAVTIDQLRDPQVDGDRVQKAEWLVALGICTHLGCVPINGAGDFGGYFCPCHGSHYDASGRIRKGPAPLNLVR